MEPGLLVISRNKAPTPEFGHQRLPAQYLPQVLQPVICQFASSTIISGTGHLTLMIQLYNVTLILTYFIKQLIQIWRIIFWPHSPYPPYYFSMKINGMQEHPLGNICIHEGCRLHPTICFIVLIQFNGVCGNLWLSLTLCNLLNFNGVDDKGSQSWWYEKI